MKTLTVFLMKFKKLNKQRKKLKTITVQDIKSLRLDQKQDHLLSKNKLINKKKMLIVFHKRFQLLFKMRMRKMQNNNN